MFNYSESLDCKYAVSPSCVAKLPNGFFSHDGDQIGFNDGCYAVGKVCLDPTARLEWDRPINSKPDSEEWQALFFHGLALHKKSELVVVTGLPHTLRTKINAESMIPTGEIDLLIAHEGKPIQRKKKIVRVMVRSECEAHAIAFRRSYGEPSLVLSLGFGTVELGACDKAGRILPASLDSKTYGLHHCASRLQKALVGIGYEKPEVRDNQFSFFDKILKDVYGDDAKFCLRSPSRGVIYREELLPHCEKILSEYADNLISQLKVYFNKFDDKMPVVLTGGGTLYDSLISKLSDYITSLNYEVKIADKDMSVLSAAMGYKIIAEELDPERGVGIDVGNSSVVTIISSEGVFN